MKQPIITGIIVLILMSWGCSHRPKSSQQNTASVTKTSGQESGLTPFQLKNGIGPITKEVTVGPLNKTLAKKGQEIFENKCSSCHKIGQRYVGPDLKEVTSRRTPTYIMNMMMNPEGMIQKHPVAHGLLEKFSTPMANMHVTRDQARAIVEYFRSVNPNSK